jgi:hypothetical protein
MWPFSIRNFNISATTATGGLVVTWLVKFIMRHSVADPFQSVADQAGVIRNDLSGTRGKIEWRYRQRRTPAATLMLKGTRLL